MLFVFISSSSRLIRFRSTYLATCAARLWCSFLQYRTDLKKCQGASILQHCIHSSRSRHTHTDDRRLGGAAIFHSPRVGSRWPGTRRRLGPTPGRPFSAAHCSQTGIRLAQQSGLGSVPRPAAELLCLHSTQDRAVHRSGAGQSWKTGAGGRRAISGTEALTRMWRMVYGQRSPSKCGLCVGRGKSTPFTVYLRRLPPPTTTSAAASCSCHTAASCSCRYRILLLLQLPLPPTPAPTAASCSCGLRLPLPPLPAR